MELFTEINKHMEQRRTEGLGADLFSDTLRDNIGFGVERGRGFIEQDERHVPDQRAGDRDALALPAGQLRAEFSDRRGDVYAAQGKVADARAAYAEALGKAGAQPLRSLIQMKLDALPPDGA